MCYSHPVAARCVLFLHSQITRPWESSGSRPAIVCCVAALLGAVTSTLAQGNQTLRVVPLVRAAKFLVSFELTGGLTDEVRSAIRSGLRTTFTYTVELRLDIPAWVDRSISTAIVASSVEYHNLTRTIKSSG